MTTTLGTTFVTGGSGHIGANLVRALIARGDAVRALVRRRDDPALAGLELDCVEGSLGDPVSLERAMRGCDRVYHLAAFVSLRRGDRQQLFDVNVVGTKNVVEAAERAGIRRIVACSSFGAVGRNASGESDESFTLNPFEPHLDYDLSKALAELEVLRGCARGLDAVIVNPSGVVGPLDYKPSSMGQTIVDFAHRKIPAYTPGAFEFVAVDDVVNGLVLAMERGRSGQRYILSGAHHTLDEILDELQAVLGVARPRLRVPPRVMLPIAHLSTAWMRSFFPDVPPRFTPGTIRMLNAGKRASTKKAREQLGFQPTPVFAALRAQVDWFRARRTIQ